MHTQIKIQRFIKIKCKENLMGISFLIQIDYFHNKRNQVLYCTNSPTPIYSLCYISLCCNLVVHNSILFLIWWQYFFFLKERFLLGSGCIKVLYACCTWWIYNNWSHRAAIRNSHIIFSQMFLPWHPFLLFKASFNQRPLWITYVFALAVQRRPRLNSIKFKMPLTDCRSDATFC